MLIEFGNLDELKKEEINSFMQSVIGILRNNRAVKNNRIHFKFNRLLTDSNTVSIYYFEKSSNQKIAKRMEEFLFARGFKLRIKISLIETLS